MSCLNNSLGQPELSNYIQERGISGNRGTISCFHSTPDVASLVCLFNTKLLQDGGRSMRDNVVNTSFLQPMMRCFGIIPYKPVQVLKNQYRVNCLLQCFNLCHCVVLNSFCLGCNSTHQGHAICIICCLICPGTHVTSLDSGVASVRLSTDISRSTLFIADPFGAQHRTTSQSISNFLVIANRKLLWQFS